MFAGWKVVAGAGTGIAFGSAVFVSSSFALLSAAIGQQFGWSPPELALGASIVLLMQVFTYPLAGALADRMGSRRAALVAIECFALALLFLSRIGSWNELYAGSPQIQFYASFVLIGLLAAGTNVVSYARALANWFERKRGLALGVAASFQAVGATVMPLALQKMIGVWGWSSALVLLASFLLLVCLPVVAIFVKDSPEPYGLRPDGSEPATVVKSAAVPAAERTSLVRLIADDNFRKLALAFAVMGLASYALTTNIVYILTNTAGLTADRVAVVQAITGASVLIGRIGFGYLLDRFQASTVALVSVVMAALVYVSYASGGTFETIVLTAMAAGTAIGGESDLMPYLAGRYFGASGVSTVFGWFLSAFVIGAAFGPVAFAQASVYLGGPFVPLLCIAGLHIIPAIMFLTVAAPPSVRSAD